MGIIAEYCGIQRSGKTTLMMADLMLKLLVEERFGYERKEVYSNFFIDIPGVNNLDNEGLLWTLEKAKDQAWMHKVFLIDECSQPPMLYARNSRSELQTKIVTSAWQIPKKFSTILYSSNPGNSVDVQLRDATQLCLMMMGYERNSDRKLEAVNFRVIHAWEQWQYDLRFSDPAGIQDYFDSFKPVL